MSAELIDLIFAFHEGTKHHFHRYAPGPGGLDWANQPDPFRRYHGAPLVNLKIPRTEAGNPASSPPAEFNAHTISELFYSSLAISAWKQAGGSRWALRVNPSSGNLHPTESYLLCGSLPGLNEQPAVYHYAPRVHGLEFRAAIAQDAWSRLINQWPSPVFFVGLSSVPWRESWKYGERALRYCQHDVGHALAALRIAAALLGWDAILLDYLGVDDLTLLMGLRHFPEIEPEHPDCLLAIFPHAARRPAVALNPDIIGSPGKLEWLGQPNRLSREIIEWPMIAEAWSAMHQPRSQLWPFGSAPAVIGGHTARYDRKLIRQRRSAVAMDGATYISQESFYNMLEATLPGQVPFDLLPRPPCVHLALFVHRVRSLAPGLYCLMRNSARRSDFQAECQRDFEWVKSPHCPVGLDLYRLKTMDARETSALLSCYQEIAADGCFSLSMLAEFRDSIQQIGPWFYPRLFWECGLIGQVLYLEAEKVGLRGTGIGCFFDDAMHQLLGLHSIRYQSLYHFTVGGPVEDPRITALPSYP